MLEIKDLSVQYGKQAPTIEHFNLSMKKGEIISVVGESGSGKTTVIRAVLGALAGGGRVTVVFPLPLSPTTLIISPFFMERLKCSMVGACFPY